MGVHPAPREFPEPLNLETPGFHTEIRVWRGGGEREDVWAMTGSQYYVRGHDILGGSRGAWNIPTHPPPTPQRTKCYVYKCYGLILIFSVSVITLQGLKVSEL